MWATACRFYSTSWAQIVCAWEGQMQNVSEEPGHRAPETFWERASAAEEIIVRGDAKGTILFVSDSCRALGYVPTELVGLPADALVHPDDREKLRANTASIFDPDIAKPADRIHRYRHADGSWVWLEGHPTILPGHDGRLGNILNVFRVVTEAAA